MRDSEQGGFPTLLQLCIQVIATGDYWRVKRRHLEYLPSDAANEVLSRLWRSGRITAPHQLELFKHCVTSAAPPAAACGPQHLTYLAGFRHLESLALKNHHRLKPAQLACLGQLHGCLTRLDLQGCSSLTQSVLAHLQPLTGLQALVLSGTGIKGADLAPVTHHTQLTQLHVGGLEVPDHVVVDHLVPRLTNLQDLDLSQSYLTAASQCSLVQLPRLRRLSLAGTPVKILVVPPSVVWLDLSSCRIGFDVTEVEEEAAWGQLDGPLQLQELHLEGAQLDRSGCENLHRTLLSCATTLQELHLHQTSAADVEQLLLPLLDATALTKLDMRVAEASTVSQCAGMQLVGALTQLQWLQVGPVWQVHPASSLLGTLHSLKHLDLQQVRCGAGCPDQTALTHLTALTSLSAPLGWLSAAAVDSRYRALLDSVDAYGNPVQPQAADYRQLLAAGQQQQPQQQGVGDVHARLLPDLAGSDDEDSSETEASEESSDMGNDTDTADSSVDEEDEEEESEEDAPGPAQPRHQQGPRHVVHAAEEDAGEAEQRLATRLLREGARCALPALRELRLICHGLGASLRLLACCTGSVTHLSYGSYQAWGVEQRLLSACKQLQSLVLAVEAVSVQRLQGLLSQLPHLHTLHLLATQEPVAASHQKLVELAGLAAANPQLLCLTYNQQVLVDVRDWLRRVVPSAHLLEAGSIVTTAAGRSSTTVAPGGSSTSTGPAGGAAATVHRRRSSGTGSMAEATAAAGAAAAAPAGASAVGVAKKSSSKQQKAAPLTAALLEHDERIRYSQYDLEQLRASPIVATQGLPVGLKEHGCYTAW